MDSRPFGTCFFEQYAQITLATFLGGEMTSLVNRDRPDLQSPDGASVGIEVTRAMEESKLAQEALMKDIAGVTPSPRDEEIEQILEYGYAYGLKKGKYIGLKELSYWSMAHPMKRILESKVSKVGNGFYGNFDKMGLFVFSRENLGEKEAIDAITTLSSCGSTRITATTGFSLLTSMTCSCAISMTGSRRAPD